MSRKGEALQPAARVAEGHNRALSDETYNRAMSPLRPPVPAMLPQEPPECLLEPPPQAQRAPWLTPPPGKEPSLEHRTAFTLCLPAEFQHCRQSQHWLRTQLAGLHSCTGRSCSRSQMTQEAYWPMHGSRCRGWTTLIQLPCPSPAQSSAPLQRQALHGLRGGCNDQRKTVFTRGEISRGHVPICLSFFMSSEREWLCRNPP